MEGHSERPGLLDDYMRDVYTPMESDFNALAKSVRENSKRMKGVYTNASSKIFAHAVHTHTAVINGVLADLDFAEMEISLKAIWNFYEHVWKMYENGPNPAMRFQSTPIEKK